MKIFKHITANEEKLHPFPFKSELPMEAYIFENERVLGLDDKYYPCDDVEVITNQMTLDNAGVSNDTNGRLDILAKYGADCLGVVEIKKTN